MADEIPNPESAQQPAKAPFPWLSIALVLLIIPFITLVLTEYLVIPRLKDSMQAIYEQSSTEVATAEEPEHAEPEDSHGGHSSSHSAHSEASDSGHDSSHKAVAKRGNTVVFEDVVSNLKGTMGTRFIKVSFELNSEDGRLGDQIDAHRPRVQDAIITTLSGHTIQEIESIGGRNGLRLALIASINEAIGQEMVDELYFMKFIIQ